MTPYLLMPWCEQRFPENQEKITAALWQIAAEEGIAAIPVGDVWQEFQCIVPDETFYWTDGEHASVVGDYLIAGTACMAISGRTDIVLGNTARDFTRGAFIDFDHPVVCEDTVQTRCTVSQNIANGVQTAAKTILLNRQ